MREALGSLRRSEVGLAPPHSACFQGLFPPPTLFHKVVWMVTFSAAIFLGLDVGLLISLGFTFFIITVRSHRYSASGRCRTAVHGKGAGT